MFKITLHQKVFHYQKYLKLRILINIIGQLKFLKLFMIQLNVITKKNMRLNRQINSLLKDFYQVVFVLIHGKLKILIRMGI